MADLTAPMPLSRARRRRSPAPRPRRRFPWARVLFTFCLLGALAGGISYGAWLAVPIIQQELEALAGREIIFETPSRNTILPFIPVQYLNAGKIRDEYLQIALGPVRDDSRPVALVVGNDGTFRQQGPVLTLPDQEYTLQNLARGENVLVGRSFLPATSATPAGLLDSTPVIVSQGGEPVYRAWTVDTERGELKEVNYYELAAPLEPPAQNAILVDKQLNVLWYYENGQLVHTFRVATGRHLSGPQPTARNQARNHLTPPGWFQIANRVEGSIVYQREKIPAGDPKNPVTAYWMGMSVYPGDPGLTWGIHGTDRLDEIGRWTTDGSIRLAVSDAEKLFGRVQLGTTVVIRERE